MDKKNYVPVTLEDGTIIYIEAEELDNNVIKESTGFEEEGAGFEEVSSGGVSRRVLRGFTRSIGTIAREIHTSLDNSFEVGPDKITVEFGAKVTVGGEGNLIAILVKGNLDANVNVKLEWENKAESNE